MEINYYILWQIIDDGFCVLEKLGFCMQMFDTGFSSMSTGSVYKATDALLQDWDKESGTRSVYSSRYTASSGPLGCLEGVLRQSQCLSVSPHLSLRGNSWCIKMVR